MDSNPQKIYMARLKPEELDIKIYLVPINMLHPHEKSIEPLKKYLRCRLENDKILKDPLLADYKRRLIIDGTHRALALKELSLEYAPVQHLDYMDPKLKLYRWFRVFKGMNGIPSEIRERIVSEKDFEQNDINRYPLYIIYGGKTYILEDEGNIEDIINGVEEAEKILVELYGVRPSFMSEDEILKDQDILNDKTRLILGYRMVRKEEVLQAHKKGILFHHKATRHVPPYRVISIDLPIEYLTRENIDKALKHLRRIVVEYVGEKVTIDGRYYAEKIYRGRESCTCED